MAIEKIITVKSTEQAMAKNNTPYLKVTSQDDKTYSIFDQGLWNLFGEGLAVKLGLEKKGNFWNVMSAESIEQAIEEVSKIGARAPITREASIEQQVAIKEIGECWRIGKLKDNDPLVVGYLLWLIDRLNYEEAKSETTKDNKGDKETQGELADRQDSRETTDGTVKNAGELFGWIMSKDPSIKAPRLWVQTEFGLSDKEVLTDKKAMALYKTIKQKMSW